MKRYEQITLDRVKLYTTCAVDAEIVYKKLNHRIEAGELRLLEDMNAYERRHLLRLFGKQERWEFSCPATWWQHLKHTLRARWPKLFRRLKVRTRVAAFDSGWVCPDLASKVSASRMVIPYVTGPHDTEWRR